MNDPRRLKRGILLLLAYCAIFFLPYYTALFHQIQQHWTR
jgi:hypothetical protein